MTEKIKISLQSIIDNLNSILECDKKSIEELIEHRITCTMELAKHPTVQVLYNDAIKSNTVGFLGMLNGVLGAREDGFGYVTALCDEAGHIIKFEITPDDFVSSTEE
jgi:hypothetical protein